MVSRVTTFVLGHHHALTLGAHEDLVFGALKILHLDESAIASRGHQSRFVTQVGQVSAGHAGRAACNHRSVHVCAERNLAHVHIEDLLATTDIGQGHVNLAVKAPRAQQRSIQNIWAVGGCHHDHAEVGLETVHLHQHLVECLLALVVSTAQASATLTANGINLIHKNNARCVLLCILKHVANTGGTHAHEHLNEV